MKRTVFFVSDQTGITAETLGHSLMTQFDGIEFRQVTVPFIATVDKAIEAVRRIDLVGGEEGVRPIIFSTIVSEEVRNVVRGSSGYFLDFFDPFLVPLEAELKTVSTHVSSRAHRMADTHSYALRIDATNFALANDDGAITRDYARADLILVGVSRSGKTPTCLYLAMQYGIFAANYPLTEEDLEARCLPPALDNFARKLFALTITPDRLQQIRNERRPDSRYASAAQVAFEVRAAESLFARNGIPVLDTTEVSIEEIATRILDRTGIERRLRP
ncbi:MAG TPA: pyruvate, water dikinase regulatory protein [Steroidobacteraceae bacterium]|nr:pyruvate, water dikinase regulatory protein [Steroidobacteraceae bacterium]